MLYHPKQIYMGIIEENSRLKVAKNLSEWKFDATQTTFKTIYDYMDEMKEYPDLYQEAVNLLADKVSSLSEFRNFRTFNPDNVLITKAFIHALQGNTDFISAHITWREVHKLKLEELEVIAIMHMAKVAESFCDHKVIFQKLPNTLVNKHSDRLTTLKVETRKILFETAKIFEDVKFIFTLANNKEEKELCFYKFALAVDTDTEYFEITQFKSEEKKNGLSRAIQEIEEPKKLNRLSQSFPCIAEKCQIRMEELQGILV